jgi:hypothetical protein
MSLGTSPSNADLPRAELDRAIASVAGTALSLTNMVWNAVPGASINTPYAGTFLVIATFEFDVSPTGGSAEGDAWANGTSITTANQRARLIHDNGGANDPISISRRPVPFFGITPSMGAGQAIQLRARKTNGAAADVLSAKLTIIGSGP